MGSYADNSVSDIRGHRSCHHGNASSLSKVNSRFLNIINKLDPDNNKLNM